MLQIYNRLLELPLFLGIGATDLAEIVRTTRFGFLKLKPKEILAKENEKSGKYGSDNRSGTWNSQYKYQIE